MVTATATQEASSILPINQQLLRAVNSSVEDAMGMCGLQAVCMGASAVPVPGNGSLTGLIGVHGDASGFVTVNLGEILALKAVSGLLQEEFSEMSAQIIDGLGEITNLISGGIKARLAKSDWKFSKITVPSVIVGDSYQITYVKGLEFISVTYEQQDSASIMLEQRLLNVSMSLLRL